MAYTNIDDPSAHFQTAVHTSTNAGTITNDGNSDLQPDLIWSKARGSAFNHALYDSTRGVTKFLSSNATSAETTASSGFDLTSFNTDGFSTGNNQFNTICGGTTYVAWQWKANGGTTSSNTDGSLTSTVQANTTAGFSIVTYSNPSTNDNTIGHGLGVQPEIIIFKNTVDASNWYVASKYLSNYTTKYLELDTTDAEQTHADGMNSTAPTSSVFSVGGISRTGDQGNLAVAYCFASKQGYSKFGSYVGNGNADGSFVYTGFKPAFVMLKRTNGAGGWTIYDNKRGYNGNNYELFPNSSEAEYTGTSYFEADILSNGFKLRLTNSQVNGSGDSYIYMAFAENPFVTSTGIPTTAR